LPSVHKKCVAVYFIAVGLSAKRIDYQQLPGRFAVFLFSVAFAVNLQNFGKETVCDKRPVYPHLRELQRYKVLIIMTIN